MTEKDLNPCSYCGESDCRIETSVLFKSEHPHSFKGEVACNNCELSVTRYGTHRKEAAQEAIKAWNELGEVTP